MEDARKDQKVKAQTLRAKYKSATLEEFIDHHGKDISRSGMFIKTPKPPALGALLKIEIQLKDGTPVLGAVGRVVQRREEADARPDAPAGMGLRFLKIDDGSKPVIEAIVGRKGEAAGPHFESLRPPPATTSTPAPPMETHSEFFGSTSPATQMPAEQDRTEMRQMSALLGEALRIARDEQAPAKAEATSEEPAKKPVVVETMKATIVGVAPVTPSDAPPAEEPDDGPLRMRSERPTSPLDLSAASHAADDSADTAVASRKDIDAALETMRALAEPTPAEPPPPPATRPLGPEPEAATEEPRDSLEGKTTTVMTASTRPAAIEADDAKATAVMPAVSEDDAKATAVMPAVSEDDAKATAVMPAVMASETEAKAEAKAEAKTEDEVEARPSLEGKTTTVMEAPAKKAEENSIEVTPSLTGAEDGLAKLKPAEPMRVAPAVTAERAKKPFPVVWMVVGAATLVGAGLWLALGGGSDTHSDTPRPTTNAPAVTEPAPTPPTPPAHPEVPARPSVDPTPQNPSMVVDPAAQPAPPSLGEPSTPAAPAAPEPSAPAAPQPAPEPAPTVAPSAPQAHDPTPSPATPEPSPAVPVPTAVAPRPAAPRPAARPVARPAAPAPAARPAAPPVRRPSNPALTNGAVPPNPFE